jgi:hypothetical protein
MANKRSHKNASPGPTNPPLTDVESLIRKERFADAVKQARADHQQAQTPESHRLLERAYFLRARQLAKLGMTVSAVEVARQLVEFGVTPSEWVDDFVRLLINVGLLQDAFQIDKRLGTTELKNDLTAMIADQAVIHPERVPHLSAELARDVSLVRASLERLQANDEAGAIALLRELARSSPLSDWKLFIRGLVAHYRHHADETRANWERLDSRRKAFAVASRLRRLAQVEAGNTDEKLLERIETVVFGEPVLARLRNASNLAAAQDWRKLFRLLKSLRQALRRIDPKLAERLTGVLHGQLIKDIRERDPDEVAELLEGFTSAAEPMSFDPHWNRFHAIAWDGPNCDPFLSRGRWMVYIQDLNTISIFSPGERALAQALVWNHLARSWHDEATALGDEENDDRSPLPLLPGLSRKAMRDIAREDARRLDEAKKKSIECLERSLELAPDHLASYQLLVEINRDRNDPAGTQAAALRLLAKFPDDLETLSLLSEQYRAQDNFAAALPLVQRARALKPLDESIRDVEYNVRISLARNLALEGCWNAGRDQFRAADELYPDHSHDYFLLARKALLEAKAGQADISEQFIRQAESSLAEPTPLWLALAIESIRYGMTKATQDHYTQLFESALNRKARRETAAEIASLLTGYMLSNIAYPGRERHVSLVADYLERASRLKYERREIEAVCKFLGCLPHKTKLLEKRVQQGLKQHPTSVALNLRAGLLELGREHQRYAGDKAGRYLETALKLAEASTTPEDADLLPSIRNALTLVNEMREPPLGFGQFGGGDFPFPLPGGSFGPSPFDDEFDDFDDGYFDDNGFMPSFSKAPTRRHPRKPSRRKRRKKP